MDKHTQKISTTHQTPCVDARLAHLWEARRSLTKRWKRQRHNRKLRKKINEISRKAAEYAAELCKESWLSLCDDLRGTLSTRKTWQLLRHLIDPLASKSATNRSLARTLSNYAGGAKKLMEDLKDRYLNTEKSVEQPGLYRGTSNEVLDRPFIDSEIRTAISERDKRSSPGPDNITYRIFNNLSDKSRQELLGKRRVARQLEGGGSPVHPQGWEVTTHR